jgi:hypothetical protein
MNNETINNLAKEGISVWFSDANINLKPFEDATHYGIAQWEPEYLSIRGKLPKRVPFDAAYVYEQIAKKQKYEAIDYNAIFAPLKIQNARFYTTSYGLGVDVIFGNKTDTIDTIRKHLEANNILFSEEYSEAHWVYRFKISKAKENIERLNTLC